MRNVRIFFLILFYSSSMSQQIDTTFYKRHLKVRIKDQLSFNDSSRVFWTAFPDPFSHGTYLDRRTISRMISFYCNLPGNLKISILDTQLDSTVHSFSVQQEEENSFYFWIWTADTSANINSITNDYFLVSTKGPFQCLLEVDDEKKTLHPKILNIPNKKYCYLTGNIYIKESKLKKENTRRGRRKSD